VAMDVFKDRCLLIQMDASIFGYCKPFLFHQAKPLATISMVCRSIIRSLLQTFPRVRLHALTNKKDLLEYEP
jgi:hypothetical protein